MHKIFLILCILLVTTVSRAQFQEVPANQVKVVNTNFTTITGTNAQQVFESIDRVITNAVGGTNNVNSWARYIAVTNVDINNKNIDNVNSINFGGVTRTNWPVASQITNDSDVAGSTVMDALNTLKAGTLLIMENGPTSILYVVTSGGHTNFVGRYYSE